MRIGVISDTHGRKETARQAVEQMGPIELLLHAGDHYTDCRYLQEHFPFPIYGVKGNCDYDGPEEQLVTAGNFKILLIHGHQYGVKSSLQKLAYRAQELGANLVVFGHTHTAETEWFEDVLIFNPGSIARPRGFDGRPSYGVIEIVENQLKPYIKKLEQIG